MGPEEAFEGLGLEQRTPQTKSELGCALLELFNQIAHLRDPRGGFAVTTVSISRHNNEFSERLPVFQVPDQRYETVRFQDPKKLRCGGIVVRTPVKGLRGRETSVVADVASPNTMI